ncbi:MAG: UDP-4-amino-4,6-dideoxy-N-acetyl-beta-L-altrosamine transaminase [Chthonomonadales bacterium]
MNSSRLAVDGGTPIRSTLLPYGRQAVDEADIQAVTAALRSDWLTTGPKVAEFEEALVAVTGAAEAVAVSSGTAALDAAVFALGVGPGDEVIVPPMTFAATANAVLHLGARPVFADVEPGTLLLDPKRVEEKISSHTKAVIGVDYTGHPCEWDDLAEVARTHRLKLIADACHALGAEYRGRSVGTLADVTCFSFHPVKQIATGEGGAAVTGDAEVARRMRRFRNHGIATDHRERQAAGAWFYEMIELGYNLRLSDIHAALGLSQLAKLPRWSSRRAEIAQRYTEAFSRLPSVEPLPIKPYVRHGHHLYVIRLRLDRLAVDRDHVFRALRAEGIGANVHYIPVHLHPYYQRTVGTRPGDCPVAEEAYREILTLPLFAAMSDSDVEDVIAAVYKVCEAYSR